MFKSMTFYSLHISILLYFTKLLIFSISYSYSLEIRGLILLFKIRIPFTFVQTNSVWYLQVLYLGTSYRNNNKLDIIVLSYACIHTHSNNNSYQMWSVLFSSNFIIKFTQVYHFYQYFRNGSQGQWNSHHLSIFAHIYMYIWQDTLTPIWTPQFMHTGILKNKVHCVNHFVL